MALLRVEFQQLVAYISGSMSRIDLDFRHIPNLLQLLPDIEGICFCTDIDSATHPGPPTDHIASFTLNSDKATEITELPTHGEQDGSVFVIDELWATLFMHGQSATAIAELPHNFGIMGITGLAEIAKTQFTKGLFRRSWEHIDDRSPVGSRFISGRLDVLLFALLDNLLGGPGGGKLRLTFFN